MLIIILKIFFPYRNLYLNALTNRRKYIHAKLITQVANFICFMDMTNIRRRIQSLLTF